MTKRNYLLAGAALLPIVSFYGMLARQTVNIPFMDDYSGVLGLISAWSQLGSVHEKVILMLTSQHNEYKLIFANTLYVLQYLTAGHTNIAVLATVGNLLLLPLYLVIYRMWADDCVMISCRLVLFVPVSWVLFQLQYYSLLNWPMSSLQHIAVILFSLLTIYLLSKDEQIAFGLSLTTLALAIASSGNGFFVIPVGCLMLTQFRRPMRIFYWLAAATVMLGCYIYRYNFDLSQAHADHSIISSLHHFSALYAFSFLGASIAREGSYIPAAILGACLCVVFVYATADGFYSRNPAIFYSICFILLTAVAVSGLRSDLGTAQSLVSRYRIYSNLLLIFLYLYGTQKLFGTNNDAVLEREVRLRYVTITITAILVIGFNLGSNYAGYKLLRTRTMLTKVGLCRWEHGEQPITSAPGPANEDLVIRRQRLNGNYAPQDSYLREGMLLHIYSPTTCPSDAPSF